MRIFYIKIKYIVFLIFLPFQLYFAQANTDLNSAENKKLFGDYLYLQKDYLRAFEEYKGYLKKYSNDTLILKIGEMLIEMERFSEAEDYYKMLFMHSDLRQEAKLKYYFTNFKKLKPDEFREFCETTNNFPNKYSKEINRLKQITYFYQGRYLPDTLQLFYYFSEDSSALSKVKELYFRKYYPENKSPFKAGLLSAIIPGLGKIYTEDYTDGITAFLITGLLAYLSYDNFHAKHYERGWIFAGLGGLFNWGNVYGSVASAQIYNARLKINLNGEINAFFSANNFFIPKY